MMRIIFEMKIWYWIDVEYYNEFFLKIFYLVNNFFGLFDFFNKFERRLIYSKSEENVDMYYWEIFCVIIEESNFMNIDNELIDINDMMF